MKETLDKKVSRVRALVRGLMQDEDDIRSTVKRESRLYHPPPLKHPIRLKSLPCTNLSVNLKP